MRGICRYGSLLCTMDEALVLCAVDLSGRCTLTGMFAARPKRSAILMWSALRSSGWALPEACPPRSTSCKFAGENAHHILEACLRRQATRWLQRSSSTPPTGTRFPPQRTLAVIDDH